MKKKAAESASKKGLLKEAIEDINREINNINKEKKQLNDQIKDADKNLENYRQFEKELQQRIAKLLEREAFLKDKKKRVAVDEDRLSDRLSKVRKIRSELDDV